MFGSNKHIQCKYNTIYHSKVNSWKNKMMRVGCTLTLEINGIMNRIYPLNEKVQLER